MFHRQIQGPMACQPMGRNGSLEFKVEMIHDCGCGEDYSNDQDMSMYDEDASVALDDLLVDGKAVSEANKGLATMARTNHNLLGGGNEACFSLDNDESWDDLLLCEAYHYQSNSHITETMLNESVPQQPEKIELEMESSAHRAKQQQAPPLRELLKQRSSRRMLMESARQFSSRRLLLPSMDRCSSRSLLLSAADRCSSRSLLSDILCEHEEEEEQSLLPMEPARQSSSRRLLLPSLDRRSSRSLLLSAADRCSSRSLLSDILCEEEEEEHVPPTAPRRQASARRLLLTRQSSSRRKLFASAKQSSSRRFFLKRQISSPRMLAAKAC